MKPPNPGWNHSGAILSVCAVIVLVGLVSSARAADPVCDYCGKKITDRHWIEFEDHYYHTNHFLCENCGGDLKDGAIYTERGRMYDSACYFDLFVPRCDYCGKALVGNYTEFESKLYHQNCYEEHIGPRCGLCGEPIYGEYAIDLRGNTTHASHQDEYPTCEYCGCYIAFNLTGRGHMYRDGRQVCGLCRKSAVDDDDEAEAIMTEVVADLSANGIELKEKRIPLELVDRNKMRSDSDGRKDDAPGSTSYNKKSIVPGVWTKQDFKIYILEGMPRAEFIFTLAHELMHVWLLENAPDEMSSILIEGSCQYAAILVIGNGSEAEAEMVLKRAMADEDPVYGDGLREVDQYVERVGIPAWLEYLTDHTDPPW